MRVSGNLLFTFETAGLLIAKPQYTIALPQDNLLADHRLGHGNVMMPGWHWDWLGVCEDIKKGFALSNPADNKKPFLFS